MLQSKRKPALVLQDYLQTFTEPSAIVFHPYLGTAATGAACRLEMEHSKLIGCIKDSACMPAVRP